MSWSRRGTRCLSAADMYPSIPSFAMLVGCLVVMPVVAFSAPRRAVAVPVVFSQAASDYQRARNPDGSLRPEHYVFSFGGQIGKTTTDATIEPIRSSDFVDILRRHLAGLNYHIASDAKSAQLLLRVNWGKTVPFAGDLAAATATDGVASALSTLSSFGDVLDDGFVSQEEAFDTADAAADLESAMIRLRAESRRRELANQFNAGLLGYRREMSKWAGSPAVLSAAGNVVDELRGEIEEERYYLIIFAFDFRSVAEDHKPKLRWVTRISIRAQGNRFDENLEGMVARGAHYFGRDSKGLVRTFRGKVELGETEVVGVADADPEDAAQAHSDDASEPSRKGE